MKITSTQRHYLHTLVNCTFEDGEASTIKTQPQQDFPIPARKVREEDTVEHQAIQVHPHAPSFVHLTMYNDLVPESTRWRNSHETTEPGICVPSAQYGKMQELPGAQAMVHLLLTLAQGSQCCFQTPPCSPGN